MFIIIGTSQVTCIVKGTRLKKERTKEEDYFRLVAIEQFLNTITEETGTFYKSCAIKAVHLVFGSSLVAVKIM